MKSKLKMSIKGWLFAVIFFVFAVYAGFIQYHYDGIKDIDVTFLFTNLGDYIWSLISLIIIVILYVAFSLVPSRKLTLLPNIFMLMTAGQILVQAYYTLPRLNIIGLVVELIFTITHLMLAYYLTKISFDVIDNDNDKKGYFNNWFNQLKKSLMQNYRELTIFMILYILIRSITVISVTIK
ncbi:hypothetical protein MOO46_06705 [Apilactobacillus apisilvae]|uniref:Uncharacterized protein n=1 Tax=Apilactobacillus apisilvae TaxID=2923364 RepID=A0ABY4PHD2_9LACO|nr:hypothetical protein [Apilactobacillus apisilvae]UQS84928.1 hypothetical protein MOO46_06705 [Apilactobacillus apisilvae]